MDRHCVTNENDVDFFLMNMTRYELMQKEDSRSGIGRHVNCLGIIREDDLLSGG